MPHQLPEPHLETSETPEENQAEPLAQAERYRAIAQTLRTAGYSSVTEDDVADAYQEMMRTGKRPVGIIGQVITELLHGDYPAISRCKE